MLESTHHLADHGVATVAVERRIERVDDAVMNRATRLPVAPGPLVVGDIIRD